MIEPGCILCDEPLSALDAVLREEMRAELREIVMNLGITTIFVIHDQVEAMSISDEIAVINMGRIEQQGSPEEIYHRPATPFAAHFIGRSNWLGERQMFRPEAVLFEPEQDTEEYLVRLISIRFIGNGYEFCFERGTERWYAFSPRRMPLGELRVFVKREAIFRYDDKSSSPV